MRNFRLIVRPAIFLFILIVLLALPLHSPAQGVDYRAGLRELRNGCFVYLHTDDRPGVSSTFNSGVIVTDEGVVVIDALGSEAIARQVRQAVSKATSKPIRFLISTTPHRPFTGGNAVYADTFRIAQENTRADLMKLLEKEPAEAQQNKLPRLTFREQTTLYLGGKEIRILFPGRGHTRSDTIVFLPQDRIVYMGETFYCNEFPYISSGYSADWMRTIEAAEKLGADIFVPGHGFLPKDLKETRAELSSHRQVLKEIHDAVSVQVKKGLSEDEALGAIELPQLKRFKGYQRALEIAVRRIYRELTTGLP